MLSPRKDILVAPTSDERRVALTFIARDPAAAANVWAYRRLIDKRDAMHMIAFRVLGVLLLAIVVAVAAAAAVLSGDFFENLFKLGLAPYLGLFAVGLTLIVKDRDERRALTQHAAGLPGLVNLSANHEGKLTPIGELIATEYARVVSALGAADDPVPAIQAAVKTTLSSLPPPLQPPQLGGDGAFAP